MATATKTTTPTGLPPQTFNRVLDEGYGPGAWYGADLKTAVGDVKAADAFKRPARGRHNIAEIALHQAFWAREVVKRLTGGEPKGTFPLKGEDWFELNDGKPLSWKQVLATLDDSQQLLSDAVAAIAAGKTKSPMSEAERFDTVIGISEHAAYHAGQIQLVKKLI
jgi:hypothetical protein